jgi:hypothetical protein
MAQRKRKRKPKSSKKGGRPVRGELSDRQRISSTQHYIDTLNEEDRQSGVKREEVAELQDALDDFEHAVDDETAARKERKRIKRLRRDSA